MRLAQVTTFAASKNETLADMVGRVRQGFLDAGLGEPTIRFTLTASSKGERASAINRVLKRYPELERFRADLPAALPEHLAVIQTALKAVEHLRADVPAFPLSSLAEHQLSNAASGEAVEYSMIHAILAGVPRTYPFIRVAIHFHTPAFGEAVGSLPRFGNYLPGVLVTELSGIKGRQRALDAYTVVDVEDGGQKLPPHPEPIAAALKACGRVSRSTHLLHDGGGAVSIPAANVAAVEAIVADYQSRMPEIVERARLPHDLPPASEIRHQSREINITREDLENDARGAGPRKPALDIAFEPTDYRCRGGAGEFHVTRRTSGNLTVELDLDVGTWSAEVSAVFLVKGAGFRAALGIPVAPRDRGGQYPIGDAAQWQKIVENLAAMVRELDRSFVPEIEQAAGPSPAWYQPGS